MKLPWKARRRNTPPRLTVWEKIRLYRLIKDPLMIAKLKSRKLWITVATAALLALGNALGIDAELLEKILYLGMTYVGAEGLVDASRAWSQNETPPPQ